MTWKVAHIIAIAIPALLLGILSTTVPSYARDIPQGPWLDEIVWGEEEDPSEALTALLEGRADVLTIPLYAGDERKRAEASSDIQTFPTLLITDAFLMNPSRQRPERPENPFAIDGVRAAMQLLIDREFIVREIWEDFAVSRETLWHPSSADYGRHIGNFLRLETEWAFDPHRGRTMMFEALEANGWSLGIDGLWHDANDRLVTLHGLVRTIDERLQLGHYYAEVLRGLNFDVSLPPVPSVAVCWAPYCLPPDQGVWHFYTEGFFRTTPGWDDENLWFWSCGVGFEPYCAHRSEVRTNPNVYVVNPLLADIAEAIREGEYRSLAERARLVEQGTRLYMRSPLRVFVDVRESPHAFAHDFEDAVFDLFHGAANPWFLKTARVPRDTTTDLRTARALNLIMFVDAWNPWIVGGWFYDEIQRSAMIDPGTARHPHSGLWTDFRSAFRVDTAGPDGALTVPPDALIFDTVSNSWVGVGPGLQALGRVTLDFTLGSWHHGPPLTMDDILYSLSNAYRRVFGDIWEARGIFRAAVSYPEEDFYRQELKGVRVIAGDTLEIYVDYWHLDPAEIAGYATSFTGSSTVGSLALFPNAPWEVQELAAQTILDGETDYEDWVAGAYDKTWLDLTKGESLSLLAADLTSLKAANHVPPGMESYISSEEAADRWSALETWYAEKGHFWPSQGPFFLESVDLQARTTRMMAYRDYPWPADYWDVLTTVRNARASIVSRPPPVTVSGSPASFTLRVLVGDGPSDAFEGQWFLLDPTSRTFLAQGTLTRLGQGSYEIEIPASLTESLVDGNFEVIAAVVGDEVPIPSVLREPLLIFPPPDQFLDLIDDYRDRIGRLFLDLHRELEITRSSVELQAQAVTRLTAATGIILAASIAAITISVGGLLLALIRRR